jgi:hypothetical protein
MISSVTTHSRCENLPSDLSESPQIHDALRTLRPKLGHPALVRLLRLLDFGGVNEGDFE